MSELMVYRNVKVRAVIEYEIPMWEAWQGKKQIEDYLNEYTRCHDHMIEEIEGLVVREGHEEDDFEAGKLSCLCPVSRYEYLGEAD